MQRNYVNALMRGGILFVLFATPAATAQAVPMGGYIANGEIAVQLLLDGTPVTSAAVPRNGMIPGSDSNFVGGEIGAGATSSVVDFAPYPGFPPIKPNIVFNNQVVGVGGGPANFGLNYLNPLDSGDPLNGAYIDFSGLVATLTGTSPLVGTAFDSTGLSIGFTAGSLDFPDSRPINLSGHSGLISGAGDGSFVLGTYTIPIKVDVPLITPFGNYDAVFTGSIVAASLPEPGTFILAGLGLLASIPLLRRSQRRLA